MGFAVGSRRSLTRWFRVELSTVFLLLLIQPTLVLGQADEPANPNRYSLGGRVVNSASGAPVSRALVEIPIGRGQALLTDGDGHFEFSGLPAGETTLNVRKPGFIGSEEIARRAGGWAQPRMYSVGPDTPAVTLRLVPESLIVGKLSGSEGPAEGVPVRALTWSVQDGQRQLTASGTAVSDEDGEFRIANLMAGEYYLEVGPEWMAGRTVLPKARERGYGRVFYPGPPGLDSGGALVVGAGQQAEVELSLKLEPWYRISGTLKARKPANWTLQLIDEAGSDAGPYRTRIEDGEFEAWAPAGSYTLLAQAFGPNEMVGIAEVPLTIAGDVSGLQIAPGPGLSIPVKVQRESSRSGARPTNGARFVSGGAGKSDIPVGLWLRRAGSNAKEGTPNFPATLDESGKPETLALRNIQPGTFLAEMNRVPPWYIASADCGDVDLLQETLTVSSAAPCPAIEVVLRDDGAKLKVSGTWEGDPKIAVMMLLPQNAPGQAMTVPLTKDGEMQLEDLAPGPYSVLLVDHPETLEYKNPEAMSGYAAKATHITLTANQEASVKVDLLRIGENSGQ